MPALNKTIRRNIMRLYLHAVLKENGAALQKQMREYNERALSVFNEHYAQPLIDKAETVSIKLSFADKNTVPIRSRGARKIELNLFRVSNLPFDISPVCVPGDAGYKPDAQMPYYAESVILPEDGGTFGVSTRWGIVLGRVIDTKHKEEAPAFKIPIVASQVVLPSALVKKLNAEYEKINQHLKEIIEALETINTVLVTSKSTDSLKGVWPEGASIINHAVVKSSNTLPIKYIKQANEIAKLR